MSSRDIEIVHRRTQSFFVRKKVNKEHSDKLFGYRLNEFNVAHTYDEMSKFVASRSCSVLINIGTPRKLSSQFIDLFDDGVINIHPGYLPLYRGSSAVEWALLEKNPVVNTVHYMNSEYDSGPIIGHFPVPILSSDNYFDVRIKTHLHSISLATQIVGHHIDGLIKRYPSFVQSQLDLVPRPPVTNEQLSELINSYGKGQSFEKSNSYPDLINPKVFLNPQSIYNPFKS